MKTMFGRMSGTGITPQVRSGLPPTNSPLRDSAPPLTRMTRQPLIRRSVRSRCRASGGRLVSHISRRSTRPAPSPCWIDLSVIKAPAQRPCGRRCRAISAHRPQEGEWYQGAPAPWTPTDGTTLTTSRWTGPSSQPSRSLRTDARWPRTCPLDATKGPSDDCSGRRLGGARPVCPRSDGSRQPSRGNRLADPLGPLWDHTPTKNDDRRRDPPKGRTAGQPPFPSD